MKKLFFKKGRKVKPELLDYTGLHKDVKTEMQLFVYDTNELQEILEFDVNDLKEQINTSKNNWLNVHGLNEVKIIEKIGEFLKVDQYILGDILNTTQRTKVDEYHDVLFFNLKSILPVENSENVKVEQISFLLKKDILVSFQEKRSDHFTHLRERMRAHHGIVREKKVDYLMYLLLDAIIENFYLTIEAQETKVEKLVNLSKNNDDPKVLEEIEKFRDTFNFLKRSLIPLRDSLFAIKSIKHDTIFNVIENENYSFFDRLHQESLELLEQIDYDVASLDSAANFFFSSQNHKRNEIMKTLTIVSVFFMPLTFIVGVYGMNFDNMPELHWEYGYFIVLGAMFLLLLLMIGYFKWRKWY